MCPMWFRFSSRPIGLGSVAAAAAAALCPNTVSQSEARSALARQFDSPLVDVAVYFSVCSFAVT